MDAKNKRSVILLGHAQSGKTSLAESLLFRCKATSRKGTVVEGNTVSDYSWDEIERRSSINEIIGIKGTVLFFSCPAIKKILQMAQ